MNLIERLAVIHELPTLPEIALRIRSVVFSTDGDAALLAGIIERDPSLSARVLKIANSSFYGGRAGQITSVQRAVTRIGFNEIGNIVLAVSLINQFSRRSHRLDYRSFWSHSLAAATLNGMIARELDLDSSPETAQRCFLAGLLHDIGILLYDQYFSPEFTALLRHAAERKHTLLSAEQELCPDETHAALGAGLLSLWNIDPEVSDAVRDHHCKPSARHSDKSYLSHATRLTEWLLSAQRQGHIEEGAVSPLTEVVAEPLSAELLEGLTEKTLEAIDHAKEFFGSLRQ